MRLRWNTWILQHLQIWYLYLSLIDCGKGNRPSVRPSFIHSYFVRSFVHSFIIFI